MAAYLDDNPPNHQQFRCPRRQRPSGIIGVHTAESHPDESGPDTGAENVARFIRTRSGYGSYHLLADSDSIIQLVEFRCVAYHIATHGLNEHTIGISAATQAHRWNGLDASYRDAMVRNMAKAAAHAARWLKQHYGITVPARRISLAQALRGERGFLAHADADPERRTDPGSTFPWDDFLGYYAAEMNGDDDMTPEQAAKLDGIYEVLANGNTAQLTNPRTGDDVSVRYGVQEAWQTAEQLYQVLCNSNTAEMQRPGGGTASVRYGVQQTWAGIEAVKAMVAELAAGPSADPEEFLARVEQRVEAAAAAGVDAGIPAVVGAVLEALGDRAGLSQDDVVAAVKAALREGTDTDA